MPNDSPFHRLKPPTRALSRREFLWHSGGGLGGVALAAMLARDSFGFLDAGAAPPPLHFAPKAKRVVQLFMSGAASHIDLFDFKPELIKYDGKPSDFGEKVETFQDGLGPWLKPVWEFKPYGGCGKMLGETVAELGAHVDDIAFIHNVTSRSGVHSTATTLATTGFQLPGFPGAGCWVSYGLGSMNENLPTFVVLPDHRGMPSNGVKNWDSAFLPGEHSGTVIYPGTEHPIADLHPHAAGRFVNGASERDAQELLAAMNRAHAESRAQDERLDARIKSYELAARMQMAAPEALDVKAEPEHVLRLYGLDRNPQTWDKDINEAEESYVFARNCLLARRLVERGVRFVQLYHTNWDHHGGTTENLETHLPEVCGQIDRASAALVVDLERRGLLDDTIVVWGGEFGRTPMGEKRESTGRNHHIDAFTMWFAGGGFRPGLVHGETDEFGFAPVAGGLHVRDIHATLLHCLGLDHQRLAVRFQGLDYKLTGVKPARVATELLS